MADIVDHAQDLIESSMKDTLSKLNAHNIPFSGFCLSCEEPVTERRYCDKHCRMDHEKALLAHRRR